MRPDDRLTPAEAQAFLGMPASTFYRLKRGGKLPRPCAWVGRTPQYSRAELHAWKVLHLPHKVPTDPVEALTVVHDLTAAASALVGRAVEVLDAQEAACGASPETARGWADPANAEQIQLRLEPLETLALQGVALHRLLCIDIPAQCAQTLKDKTDGKA
jgi:predicted DNA-binding transcriptional regulator AlpA